MERKCTFWLRETEREKKGVKREGERGGEEWRGPNRDVIIFHEMNYTMGSLISAGRMVCRKTG